MRCRAQWQTPGEAHPRFKLAPILREYGILGFIEPLGFEECALRHKRTAVEAIRAIGGLDVLRLVHDTFHHHLSGEDIFYPELTGLVHISGVADADVTVDQMLDAHRVLVDPRDRLLPEAMRGDAVDFAAPGSELWAARSGGGAAGAHLAQRGKAVFQ